MSLVNYLNLMLNSVFVLLSGKIVNPQENSLPSKQTSGIIFRLELKLAFSHSMLCGLNALCL